VAVTAESLKELIDEAQRAYDDVSEELDRALARVQELTEQRAAISAERDAFIASLERRYPDQAVPTPETPKGLSFKIVELPPNDWSYLNRSEAVERAVKELTELENFATPAAIQDLLAERGREDNRDAISAALAYLNRTNKVHSLARAQWIYGAQD
jgi:hypothetical protein